MRQNSIRIFLISLLLFSFSKEGEELSTLNDLIATTGRQLTLQKELKNLIANFQSQQDRFHQGQQTKELASQMVQTASKILSLAEEGHYLHLFFSLFCRRAEIIRRHRQEKTIYPLGYPMKSPRYLDRQTGQEMTEKVYGKFFINLLYGTSWLSHLVSFLLVPLVSRIPFFSHLYGKIQKSRWSRRKIIPFIQKFHVDTSEFLNPPDSFSSFNDFFIRKLKPTARPIVPGDNIAILPADGRYLVYENIHASDGFFVKNQKFCLETLLQNPTLAQKYAYGSMVIARLAPVDYHRFHFPLTCIPNTPQPIPGKLYSVNPAALKKHAYILAENKRVITHLTTDHFGTVLFIEVGATYVGSIHQTFTPNQSCAKGLEKGYFSFGGSSLILLFEPFHIQFDSDLLTASQKRLEVLGHMGQSLGKALENRIK